MNISFENYADIGRYLRECRESLHLTTRDISQQIHIRARYLEVLESGQLSEIPGNVYVKGYLYTYAEFLGLDKDGIIKAFEQLVKGSGRGRVFLSIPTAKENIPGRKLILFSLLFVLALCIVWYAARPKIPPARPVDEVPQRILHMFEPHQMHSLLAPVYRPACSVAYEERTYPFCLEMKLDEHESIYLGPPRRSVAEEW